jgi:hypothetical protein
VTSKTSRRSRLMVPSCQPIQLPESYVQDWVTLISSRVSIKNIVRAALDFLLFCSIISITPFHVRPYFTVSAFWEGICIFPQLLKMAPPQPLYISFISPFHPEGLFFLLGFALVISLLLTDHHEVCRFSLCASGEQHSSRLSCST